MHLENGAVMRRENTNGLDTYGWISYIRRTEIALSSEYPGRSMSVNTATQPTSFSSLFANNNSWVFGYYSTVAKRRSKASQAYERNERRWKVTLGLSGFPAPFLEYRERAVMW